MIWIVTGTATHKITPKTIAHRISHDTIWAPVNPVVEDMMPETYSSIAFPKALTMDSPAIARSEEKIAAKSHFLCLFGLGPGDSTNASMYNSHSILLSTNSLKGYIVDA